jgi:tetratricopeptide (TPR) repeat protein
MMPAELGPDAIRHLLRHLNSVPELLQHSELRNFFESGDEPDHVVHARLRSVVANALDRSLAQLGPNEIERAKRWEAIVRGCDLGGRLQKTVAIELGLSQRHLYRERLAAHESLVEHVHRELTDSLAMGPALRDVPEEGELKIEYALGLTNFWRLDDAKRLLEEVVASDYAPATRLRAINDLLAIYTLYGKDARAGLIDRLYSVARALAARVPEPEPETEAELSMLEAYAARERGDAAYVRQLHRTVGYLQSIQPTRRVCELGLRTTRALIQYHIFLSGTSMDGKVGDVQQTLTIAKSFLDRNETLPPLLWAEFYEIAAKVYFAVTGPAKVCEVYEKGLSLARRHTAPRYAAFALRGLALAHAERGDLRRAELYVRNAIVLCDQLAWREGITFTEFLLASVRLRAGDAEGALRSVTHAKNGETNPVWRSTYDITAAEALHHLGRADEALHLIDEACSELKSREWTTYLGVGEFVRAKIYADKGRPKIARAAIASAIDSLERHGMLSWLARAYDVSAQLTRNPRHHTHARELHDFLTR